MTETAITRAPTGMELLAEISRRQDCPPEVAMAVAKAAVDLQIQMNRFRWEREDRQSKIDFDNALKSCQEQIGRIAPNRKRENEIMWADYAELDRVIRPIYTAAGFSIAYGESETLREGKVLICATLSRSGQSRQFFQSVTPAGNPKMTAADMEASGQSRAQRYLLLKIFNVAVGIDADEKKPFGEEEINSWMEKLAAANDTAELNRISLEAIKAVRGDTGSVQKIGQAKNKRIKEIREAAHA